MGEGKGRERMGKEGKVRERMGKEGKVRERMGKERKRMGKEGKGTDGCGRPGCKGVARNGWEKKRLVMSDLGCADGCGRTAWVQGGGWKWVGRRSRW